MTQSQKNLVSVAALLSGKFLQKSGKFLQKSGKFLQKVNIAPLQFVTILNQAGNVIDNPKNFYPENQETVQTI